MINNFIMFVSSLMFISCSNEQIDVRRVKVAERISAMLIEPGYYIGQSDSTFEFMNQKYLIKTREFFDKDGKIGQVAILKSEGYLEFSEVEFSKLKNFLDDHGFSESIKANVVDDYHLNVNGKRFLIKKTDRNNKRIFYTATDKKEILYCLVYN